MASAKVGSPMTSCHFSTGRWLVTMVEWTPWRSSRTSSRSCRCSALSKESPPVVEHEDLGLGERFEQFRVASVGAGDGERGEQPGQPRVERAVTVAAGAVGERASALDGAGGQSDVELTSSPAFSRATVTRIVSLIGGVLSPWGRKEPDGASAGPLPQVMRDRPQERAVAAPRARVARRRRPPSGPPGCHRSPNNPQSWSLKTPHLGH